MRNLVSEGVVVEVTAPSDVDAGDFVVIGSLAGVAVTSAKSGASVPIRVNGVFSGLAPAGASEGDPVYWDPSDGALTTTTDTDTFRVGTVLRGGLVKLQG